MILDVATAPTEEPITPDEAKTHAHVDSDDEDVLLTYLIQTARELGEDIAERTFLTTVRTLEIGDWPASIRLPLPPIQSVDLIEYYDADGVLQTLAADQYIAITKKLHGWVIPADSVTWPVLYDRPDAIKITYTAGWASVQALPACIKAWCLEAVSTMYKDRETNVVGTITASLPRDFCIGLLDPVRLWIP